MTDFLFPPAGPGPVEQESYPGVTISWKVLAGDAIAGAILEFGNGAERSLNIKEATELYECIFGKKPPC